ncbi:MAG: glutathione peroxidase, partial [Aeromonas sp.]
LYQWLKQQKSGVLGSSSIKWNFTKFLIDQKGNVVDRFAPQTKPESLTEQIRLML